MKKNRSKKVWLGAAALAGAACLGTCVWAFQSALGISQYDVTLPQGMEGLDGYRIVQIADLHSAELEQDLEQALEQLQPHLIVMTGDLVNREDRDFAQALSTAALAVRFAPPTLSGATTRWITRTMIACARGWRRPGSPFWRTRAWCWTTAAHR